MQNQRYRRFIKLTGITLLTLGLVTIAASVATRLFDLNLIFSISGNVSIKRDGSPDYEPAFMGRVNAADRLRLEKGAVARVLCSNFRLWKIRSPGEFVLEHGCYPGDRKIKTRPGAGRVPTRSAANNPKIPYIISPRNTNILHNQQIVLRWNKVDGASRYRVRISGPGVNWEDEVSQTQVVYSSQDFSQNNFKPGSRYWVTVVASNEKSSRSESPIGFTVLSEEDSKKIQAEIFQLQEINSNDFKTLAEAKAYHKHGLNAMAIDVLEESIKQGSKTRAVYQRLGEIYQEVGLNRLARERYLTALELGQKEQKLEDKEEKAWIQYHLGKVNQAIGDLQDSYKYYQAAQDSFRALGDKEQAESLQQKLDYLKERF